MHFFMKRHGWLKVQIRFVFKNTLILIRFQADKTQLILTSADPLDDANWFTLKVLLFGNFMTLSKTSVISSSGGTSEKTATAKKWENYKEQVNIHVYKQGSCIKYILL